MKYQIAGSTVPFLNKSLRTESVTQWKWQMDTGGGYVDLGSTEDIDITFPGSAGVVCNIRLIASGPWGSDIVFEQAYTTVTSVGGPEIVVPTNLIDKYPGCPFDVQLDVTGGAGDLTWELVAPHELSEIDANTGRATGIIPNLVPGTWNLTVKVTDALGREDTRDIPFYGVSSTQAGIYGWFDAAHKITLDAGKVAEWGSLVTTVGSARLYQTAAISQPAYIDDDGPALEFDTTSGLTWSVPSLTNVGVLCVVDVIGETESTAFFSSICGYYSAGYWIYGIGKTTDPDKLIVTSPTNQDSLYPCELPFGGYHNVAFHAHFASPSDTKVRPVIDGVPRAIYPYNAVMRVSSVGAVGGTGVLAAPMRLKACVIYSAGTANSIHRLNAERFNDINKFLARRFGIPVKDCAGTLEVYA